jgi:peptidoglycan/xylan/chitin deacetylase (PgdA/CDA1 family)
VSWTYNLIDSPPANLKGKVVLLMYHRILAERDLERYYVQPGMYVLNSVFEQQMSYLKKNFKILRFSELLDIWKDGAWDNSQRYCVITFDDGWLDNYRNAYTILLKYNIPATIFLPTSLIGTNQWFWPDKLGFILRNILTGSESGSAGVLYDKWPWMKNEKIYNIDDKIDSIIEMVKLLYADERNRLIENAATLFHLRFPDERLLLNWEEVAEMSKKSISFGSHSASHAILTKLTPDNMKMEIRTSMDTLREKNINYVPVFCYPNGDYNDVIAELVKDTGYMAGVSTRFGIEGRIPQDQYNLHRISIHNDISSSIPLYAYRLRGSAGRFAIAH